MNHNQNDGLLKMIRRTDPMIFLDVTFNCNVDHVGGVFRWQIMK